MFKKYYRVFQGVFSLSVILFLIWYTNPLELIASLSKAPYMKLICLIVVYETLLVLLWCGGLLTLLRGYGEIGYGALVLAGIRTQVLTMVFPGRTGDISMAYLLRKKFRVRDSTTVLLIDKVITLLLVSMLAIAAVGYFYGSEHLLTCVLVLVALIMIATAILKWFPERILAVDSDSFIARILKIIGDMHNQASTKITSASLIWNLIFTALRIFLSGVCFTLILSWFGVKLSLWYILLVQAMVQIITILPVTYMGIGLVEGMNIHLLGLAGVDGAVTLAANLSTRAVQILLYLIAALCWLLPKNDSA